MPYRSTMHKPTPDVRITPEWSLRDLESLITSLDNEEGVHWTAIGGMHLVTIGSYAKGMGGTFVEAFNDALEKHR